jgi:hypothetical protein
LLICFLGKAQQDQISWAREAARLAGRIHCDVTLKLISSYDIKYYCDLQTLSFISSKGHYEIISTQDETKTNNAELVEVMEEREQQLLDQLDRRDRDLVSSR